MINLLLTIVMMHDGQKIVEEYRFGRYDNHASCYVSFNRAAEYGKERVKDLGYKFEYLKLECD